MENEFEDIDSTTDDGAQEAGENLENQATPDDLAEKNKQLFARAKKAEDEAKKLKQALEEAKTKTQETNTQTNTTVGLTREEAILIAKGTDERVINEASVIAKAKNIPLLDAMKDPLISAYSSQLEAEAKRAKAQLGASKGGGGSDNGDLTQRVGMSRDDHKKALGF